MATWSVPVGAALSLLEPTPTPVPVPAEVDAEAEAEVPRSALQALLMDGPASPAGEEATALALAGAAAATLPFPSLPWP